MKESNIMGYLESREMWHHVKERGRKLVPDQLPMCNEVSECVLHIGR